MVPRAENEDMNCITKVVVPHKPEIKIRKW